MAIRKSTSLPERLKKVLPQGALKIFLEVYESAYKEYQNPSKRRYGGTREETASRVAWAAVKKKYRKSDTGKWVKK